MRVSKIFKQDFEQELLCFSGAVVAIMVLFGVQFKIYFLLLFFFFLQNLQWRRKGLLKVHALGCLGFASKV